MASAAADSVCDFNLVLLRRQKAAFADSLANEAGPRQRFVLTLMSTDHANEWPSRFAGVNAGCLVTFRAVGLGRIVPCATVAAAVGQAWRGRSRAERRERVMREGDQSIKRVPPQGSDWRRLPQVGDQTGVNGPNLPPTLDEDAILGLGARRGFTLGGSTYRKRDDPTGVRSTAARL